MSTAWIVAVGVLTLLVVAVSTALVLVMSRLTALERTVTRLQQQVTRLQRQVTTQQRAGGSGADPAGPALRAASVVVMLEPERQADLALVEDIRRSGGLSVDVPTVVRVPDDEAGRSLVEDLAVDVAPFYRDTPLSEQFPSVVVLDDAGGVLASGSPATVAALEALVTRHHAHASS